MNSCDKAFQSGIFEKSSRPNHTKADLVKLRWNNCIICFSGSGNPPRDPANRRRWILGSPVPSNFEKSGILNFAGSFRSGKKHRSEKLVGVYADGPCIIFSAYSIFLSFWLTAESYWTELS